MYLSKIVINNFRIFKNLELDLQQGLNLIVGENNSGKTALIDAIRLILGTRDNERLWLSEKDFYYSTTEGYAEKFTIECTFKGFNDKEAAPFLEWIAFDKETSKYFLELKLIAQRNINHSTKYGRRIAYDITAGSDENRTQMDGFAKDLLRATYLKPLRDAEQELSSKRGSRLSQILLSHPDISTDTEKGKEEKAKIEELIKQLNDEILKKGSVYKDREEELNTKFFSKFLFEQEKLLSSISFVDPNFREILEKLELKIDKHKSQGLGVNNLLFMATELLLLKPTENEHDLPLLLIEEPEAHIHPQYQLNLINYFENQQEVQVLMTTHSPNLASKIDLEKLIIFKDGKAFPMGNEKTYLEKSDYSFLRRFLDVTKANMFFAKGIIFVEGAAEELLIPYIAEKIGKPLHKSGVSVVNVQSINLFRYSNIFARKDNQKMNIKLACVTDLDIPVNEAKYYLKKKKKNPDESTMIILSEDLEEQAKQISEKKDKISRNYRINKNCLFFSEPWTLEFAIGETDLALELYQSICISKSSATDKYTSVGQDKIKTNAKKAFDKWQEKHSTAPNRKKIIAANVYKPLYDVNIKASKPDSIQYFIELVEERITKENIQEVALREENRYFPKYLIDAIDFVTSNEAQTQEEQTECQPMPVA